MDSSRGLHPEMDFRGDDCAGLRAIADGEEICYRWSFPYFEQRTCIDPPWAHVTTDVSWLHRPLVDYWNAFVAADFGVVDVEEPRVVAHRSHLAKTTRPLKDSQTRPNSVAFKLQKTYHATYPRSAGEGFSGPLRYCC